MIILRKGKIKNFRENYDENTFLILSKNYILFSLIWTKLSVQVLCSLTDMDFININKFEMASDIAKYTR